MGVFLYSNQTLNPENVMDVFKTRGHKNIHYHIKNNGATLIVAPKIIVKNENYISGDELGCKEDYAVGIGTYFYKGSYGKSALKMIYDNLNSVLASNTVYGHYAFCIHKNGATYIFNDMSGFMRLYAYEKKGTLVISSSQTAVLSTIEKPQIDKARLAGFVAGHYGREEGYIKGLYAIDPYKYVVIKDTEKPIWINKTVPEVRRIDNLNEAVEFVSSLFKEQMNELKSAIGDTKIYIDATGGLDSRLVASNLRTSDFNFDFINYPIYGPDAEIAKLLAKGLNKKLFVQTNKPIGADYKDHYGEFDFGNNYFRQYPNPRWILENDFEFSGARGECINISDIYDDPRIFSLLPKLCHSPIINENIQKEYSDFMVNFVSGRIGIDPTKKMTEYDQVTFIQFLNGQLGDSHYCSAAQAHCYFYSIFNEFHFNHFISDIAFEAKTGRKLTIALIKKIDPVLGSYPFVSRRITKRNSVNEISELPLEYKSFLGVKKILPKFIINYIYGKLGRKFNEDMFNSIDIERYAGLFDVRELKAHMNLYSDILNRLYSIDKIIKHYNVLN